MSEAKLTEIISKAQKTLKSSFGAWNDSIDTGTSIYKYLDAEILAKKYRDEFDILKSISSDFSQISKSIQAMRSSYLPTQFFSRTGDQTVLSEEIVDDILRKESYENTFMRMLGMPSIVTPDQNPGPDDLVVPPDAIFKIVDPESGSLVEEDFDTVKIKIFGQRNRKKNDRFYVINNSIYRINTKAVLELIVGDTVSIENFTLEEKAKLFSLKYNSNGKKKIVYRKDGEQQIDVTDQVNAIKEISRDVSSEEVWGDVGQSKDGTRTFFYNPILNQVIDPEVFSTVPIPGQLEKDRQVNIDKIYKDFFKYCYLLFPPIQDSSISRCINEPDKIVAPPFVGNNFPTINKSRARPSLLESVIRIRLDRLSGTLSFVGNPEEEDPVGSIRGTVAGQDVVSDDFGIIESLFIIRLKTAIIALASKLDRDIDILIEQMDKTRRYPAEKDPESGENISTGAQVDTKVVIEGDDPEAPSENKDGDKGEDNGGQIDGDGQPKEKLPDIKYVQLQKEKIIEDSILFLLENNSEVLDLQAETQRSASIYDSHMMSNIISIVDIPRKRIGSEISSIKETRDRNGGGGGVGKGVSDINNLLGVNLGVGTLDVAVYTLALFSLPEDALLGLLSDKQFERIKNGEFKALLAGIEKKNVVDSINDLTQLIFEAYKIFEEELKSPKIIPSSSSDNSTPPTQELDEEEEEEEEEEE